MIILYLFLVFVLILILERIYCSTMKRRSLRKHDQNKGAESGTNGSSQAKRHRLLGYGIKMASDFTFMFFKLIGYLPSHHIRNWIYGNVFCLDIGEKTVIYYGLEARSPWNIRIGKGTVIGDHAILDARYGIEIGENVNFSTGVWIWTQQHNVNSPDFGTENKWGGYRLEIAHGLAAEFLFCLDVKY